MPIRRRLLRLCATPLLLGGPSVGCGSDTYEAAVTDPQGPFVQSVSRNGLTLRVRYAPPALMSLSARRHLAETRRQRGTGASEAGAPARETTAVQAEDKTQARGRQQREDAWARSRRGAHFSLRVEPETGDLVYSRLKKHGDRSDKEGLW